VFRLALRCTPRRPRFLVDHVLRMTRTQGERIA
jgi:hypothetical protein